MFSFIAWCLAAWKRQLEGTVGGYWGLFDSERRALKYPPGKAISNFPLWKWQMGFGLAASVIVFPLQEVGQHRPRSRVRCQERIGGLLKYYSYVE